MFTAKRIKEHLDSIPFKPFKLCLSDGRVFEIPHHDAAWVTKNAVEVGLNLDADGIADQVAKCAIIHIVSIEDLQAA